MIIKFSKTQSNRAPWRNFTLTYCTCRLFSNISRHILKLLVKANSVLYQILIKYDVLKKIMSKVYKFFEWSSYKCSMREKKFRTLNIYEFSSQDRFSFGSRRPPSRPLFSQGFFSCSMSEKFRFGTLYAKGTLG